MGVLLWIRARAQPLAVVSSSVPYLQVSGDAKFKAAVVDIATDSKQSMIFADPEMEKRRKVLHSLKHPPAPVKKKETGWSIADDLYDDFGR